LVFPASDVKDIDLVTRENAGALIYVTSTFMGLYGVDASLPSHFHDVIEQEPEDTGALRAFLDIFNHRIYAFFYQAWKKYRPSLRPSKNSNPHSRDVHRFLSLAGLSNVPNLSDAPVDPMRLASFAGRLGSRARNAEGLAVLLEELLDEVPVEIEENVPRWIPIAKRPAMGGGDGIRLGVNSNIGTAVYDRSSTFRVKLGPVGLNTYLSLLPGGDLADKVDWLVRLYAPDHLDYDIELTLDAEDVSGVALGDHGRLGLSAFLGKTAPSMTRLVAYDDEPAAADGK
jgi:type VI secretion system protein ImpH